MTALRKKMFRMRLLTITAADFCARDLRRNGRHRNAATVAIVKSIDEMQVARPAATSGRIDLVIPFSESPATL
jgi:hypothetical protein